MKIILLHSDFIEFEPKKKALKDAEKVEMKKKRVNECLVVLSAVEKQDENNLNQITKNFVKEVKNVAKQVKVKNIVIYPWVHLSSTPSSPKAALKVLKDSESVLKKNYKVERAPFGYYKEFQLKCKGHPLAELSREISAEDLEKQESIKEKDDNTEDGIMKEILIILTTGKIVKRTQLKKEHEDIKEVVKDELGERKSSGKKPPHLKLMQQLEISSIEGRVSDAGNLSYLPKGQFIVELIRDLCWDIFVRRLGAYPTKTPCIISKEYEGAKWMMEKFPERLYKVLPGRKEKKQEFYLRPACDYGLLSIFKNATISYKNLPLPIYEFEDNSWRYEQRGELLGMYRIRNFMMADLHTMCKDLDQAFIEYERQIREFAIQIYYELGFKPVAIVLNCKEDFFNKYKKNFIKWSKNTKLPIVVKLFKQMKTYKVAWVDVVAFDNLRRTMEVTTVQLDTETPKYWDIKYINKNNKKEYPLILHTGVGIDRTIAALLENASSEKSGSLPLWLSPTQIRVIPLSRKFLKYSEKIVDKIEKENIRVDLDDRDIHIPKKIREAEKEWVPIVLVIGPKEKATNKFSTRIRETGKIKSMKLNEIIKYVENRTKNMPYRSLPLPKLLSKRPKFVG